MKGILYGIGVGPGDPGLMTLRAKQLIEEADLVVIPVKKGGETSIAYEIARQSASIPAEKIMEVVFSMEQDLNRRKEHRVHAAEQIMEQLEKGKTIAMLTLGDVGVYSTYSYVHEILKKKGYEVLMVPGVPSFCGGAAKAGISLMDGDESFVVLPSVQGMDSIEEALNQFDNIVIMKTGKNIAKLERLLEKMGLLEHAVLVSNVGLADEYIGPVDSNREYGYFTTMIIKKGQ